MTDDGQKDDGRVRSERVMGGETEIGTIKQTRTMFSQAKTADHLYHNTVSSSVINGHPNPSIPSNFTSSYNMTHTLLLPPLPG